MKRQRCTHCDEVAVLGGRCQNCGEVAAGKVAVETDRACTWTSPAGARCTAHGTMVTPHGERYCGEHWGRTNGLLAADPDDPVAVKNLIRKALGALGGGPPQEAT